MFRSTPAAVRSGSIVRAWACAATEARVSANTALAPPCKILAGWVLPATGIRPVASSGVICSNSMPMRVINVSASASGGYCSLWVMGHRVAPVSDNARPNLLLIDGHSMAYRAFSALPAENFSTTTGQTTNAVYGFTSMLSNLLRDEDPTHLAVAFDVSSQTFRKEAYAEYKATRDETPDEFRGQIPLIEIGRASCRERE